MLEHIRKDNENNDIAPHIDLIAFALGTGLSIHNDRILDVQVHHVFRFKQETADQFPVFGFHFDHRTFGVVQRDNRDTDAIVSHHGHVRRLYIDSSANEH
jgi:hypothetical protein